MATAANAYDPFAIPTRRMTPEQVHEAAAYFGIDVSGADIETLRARVKEAGKARWIEENREAMDASNAWVEKNGLPLAKHRLF
ncbi:MAG: type II toxin-antitoxin system CcdA family antitoxin [Pseudomonadota bacterium]